MKHKLSGAPGGEDILAGMQLRLFCVSQDKYCQKKPRAASVSALWRGQGATEVDPIMQLGTYVLP